MRNGLVVTLWTWLALGVFAGTAAAQLPVLPPARAGFPVELFGSGAVTAVGVGELDGDGFMDLVVATRNRQLWVLNSIGEVRPGWPQPLPARVDSQPLIANLDGSGPKIIVSTGTTLDPTGVGSVTVFKPDGTLHWQRFSANQSGFYSSPAVADLDGDGLLEVVVSGFDQRVYVFRADGSNQSGWPVFVSDSSWSSPALADLDGDGRLEIIVGIDTHLSPGVNPSPCNPFSSPPATPNGGALVVLRSNGSPFPGFPVCIDETLMSSPAVGDIDGSGFPSIVVGTGTFYSESTGQPVGRQVHAFRRDGTPAPGWPQPVGGPVFSSPALADLDGDGILDVIVASDDKLLYAFKGNTGARIFAVPPISFFGQPSPIPLRASPVVAEVELGQFKGLGILIPVNSEVAVIAQNGVQVTDNGAHAGALTLSAPFLDSAVNGLPVVTQLDATPDLYVIFGSGNAALPDPPNGKVYAYYLGTAGALPWPQFHHDERHSGCVGSFCTPARPVPATPSKTYTVDPCRVLDTRFSSPPGPIPADVLRSFSVSGNLAALGQGGAADCGVPAGAKGVYINVVAVGALGAGHLTVFPFLSARPLASTINFSFGDTVANGVVVPICTSALGACASDLTIQMGPAAAHVVIDVTGYLAAP